VEDLEIAEKGPFNARRALLHSPANLGQPKIGNVAPKFIGALFGQCLLGGVEGASGKDANTSPAPLRGTSGSYGPKKAKAFASINHPRRYSSRLLNGRRS
jgi:hypothetical protein